ncbi:hypothetical protein KOI35_36020 [Actinoplanes bogorensis]|uniref:Serine hydrolase n=1 Tax=Paractinoplanes bogorensis TaxID=1610840 RepID=A0ABS5YZQ9_9ACTN|nr:hypothetical protein [Actinoplanes bogorensis]MBU2668932.1 hypothetical protein [Actinoplanes bogorensis]
MDREVIERPEAARLTSIPKDFHSGAVAVFDRQFWSYAESVNVRKKFRSASVIKLLIAIEYLRHAKYEKSPATLGRLRDMLALSHDGHASDFWRRIGRQAALPGLKSLMGLKDISLDPTHDTPWWGYTIVSAYDIVQIYRYLEDQMHIGWRVWIRAAMASAPTIAADGFDQSFGIPDAFQGKWPIKQGWMGKSKLSDLPKPPPRDVDFVHRTLHTTGLVGPANRNIVVVLTVHKDTTGSVTAAGLVTKLTRSLTVPGAIRR